MVFMANPDDPRDVAEFDQHKAEAEVTIDAYVYAYIQCRNLFGKDEALMAAAESVEQHADGVKGLAQHFALAIARIGEALIAGNPET